ncbi:MAG: matrixin family metalloprotease [Polyangiaceae bacterium]
MSLSPFSPLRATALVCGLGALLWAGSADAYCRAVTASPPAGYNPATQGCFDGEPDGGAVFSLFWRNQCTSYSLQNPATRQLAQSDVTRIAAQAFAAWSGASCPGGMPSITAVAYPTVQCDQVPSQEHNNVIIFRDDVWPYDDAANAIGFTTLTVDLTDGEIVGADIEINSANYQIVAQGPAMNGAYDLPSILTHEAGHFLGLAHSADKSAVMYAFYQPGSDTLTPDDISGICSTYTPEGLRTTSTGSVAQETCNAAPLLGFLSECGSLDSGVGTSFAKSVGSGAGVDGGNGKDPPAPCSEATCAAGRTPGSGIATAAGEFAICLLTALGALARRASRRR